MKKTHFLLLFSLLIASPIYGFAADMNVIWTRTGAVLETEHDITGELKVEVLSQTETLPATALQLNPKQILVQCGWAPNHNYRVTLTSDAGASVVETRTPLKPVLYPIQTIALDGMLSLMANLRRPAQPTTVAFSEDGKHVAIATDAGHLAIVAALTGELVWKTRISEGYVKHVAFSTESPDSVPSRLYIGEQAADGFIYAYAVSTSQEKSPSTVVRGTVPREEKPHSTVTRGTVPREEKPPSPVARGPVPREEQSPSAVARGPVPREEKRDYQQLWKYRTADDIETSTPQEPGSVYAWVQYPGPSRMLTLSDGDVLVASVHSWTKDNVPMKKSQLYRFDGETGTVKWKWPADGALPKVLRWFDVSADGKTLALVADASGKGNGRLVVIDVETGTERWHATFEPLKPYFEGVTFWRGVSITPDGRFINVTTDDGRAFIFRSIPSVGQEHSNLTRAEAGEQNEQEPVWHQNLATPLEVSGVPIIATSGTIGATDAAALFVTGDTYIPYHLQKGAQRPPTAHPNGMTLFAYSWEGEKVWQWQLENMPQGLRIDAAGRYAILAVSKRSQNPNESLHGVSLFDLEAEGGGLAKYLYTYRTEGQLPYDTLAISADGTFVAVVEVPLVLPDETVRGKNRVHILY